MNVAMVLLNPSKAGGIDDDPTVRKSVGFARRHQPLPDRLVLRPGVPGGAVFGDGAMSRLSGHWIAGTRPAAEEDAAPYRYQLWRPIGDGRLDIVNMYGWRATDPKKLAAARAAGCDVIGPFNDELLVEACRTADVVIVGWGSLAARRWAEERAAHVLEMLHALGKEAWCLGTTKDGQPSHPLMLPYSTPLVPYPPPEQAQAQAGAR